MSKYYVEINNSSRYTWFWKCEKGCWYYRRSDLSIWNPTRTRTPHVLSNTTPVSEREMVVITLEAQSNGV